jgi:hypothetical protein
MARCFRLALGDHYHPHERSLPEHHISDFPKRKYAQLAIRIMRRGVHRQGLLPIHHGPTPVVDVRAAIDLLFAQGCVDAPW